MTGKFHQHMQNINQREKTHSYLTHDNLLSGTHTNTSTSLNVDLSLLFTHRDTHSSSESSKTINEGETGGGRGGNDQEDLTLQ